MPASKNATVKDHGHDRHHREGPCGPQPRAMKRGARCDHRRQRRPHAHGLDEHNRGDEVTGSSTPQEHETCGEAERHLEAEVEGMNDVSDRLFAGRPPKGPGRRSEQIPLSQASASSAAKVREKAAMVRRGARSPNATAKRTATRRRERDRRERNREEQRRSAPAACLGEHRIWHWCG